MELPVNAILRSDAVARLWEALEEDEERRSYLKGHIRIDKDEILPIRGGKLPELSVKSQSDRAADDFQNAVQLFDALADIGETRASDERYWTYLTHTVYLDYTRKRWPVPNESEKQTRFIAEHWFCRGGDRALRRNSIARLWWAIYLTKAPWKRDEYFADLRCDDDYRYTRVLLSAQDIFQQTLERSFGRDSRILIRVLEALRKHPKVASERGRLRDFVKGVNIAGGFRSLGVLQGKDLGAVLAEIC